VSHKENERVSVSVDNYQIQRLILDAAEGLVNWGRSAMLTRWSNSTRYDAIRAAEEIIRLAEKLPEDK
jgi:hypothetical protein